MNNPMPTKLDDEKPPFLNTWKNVYFLQIIILAIVILIFNLITNFYNK